MRRGGRPAAVRRSRWWPIAAVLALELGHAPLAAAQPTLWQRARSEARAQQYESFVGAERMLDRASQAAPQASLERSFTRTAAAFLALASEGQRAEPRLRFLLGRVSANPWIDRPSEAIRWLAPLLKQQADAPFAGQAALCLATSYSALGRVPRAELAFEEALKRLWVPDERMEAYLGRAEMRLRLGRVPAALGDFGQAARLATTSLNQARVYYGWAAALERDGNGPAALEKAALAHAIRLRKSRFGVTNPLEVPGGQWRPRYEAYARQALGELAAARRSPSLESRVELLRESCADWERYLGRLGVAGSVASRARRRAAQCQAELADAAEGLAEELADQPTKAPGATGRAGPD